MNLISGDVAMRSRLRIFLASLLAWAADLAFGIRALAQTDPLPVWNDVPAKQAIVEFVQTTTDKSSPKFVPPAEPIATFDNDGTLWVEHPIYTQLAFALDQVNSTPPMTHTVTHISPFGRSLRRQGILGERRNRGHEDVDRHRHPWPLDSGTPCRNDGNRWTCV
jgi:hypothetical protein